MAAVDASPASVKGRQWKKERPRAPNIIVASTAARCRRAGKYRCRTPRVVAGFGKGGHDMGKRSSAPSFMFSVPPAVPSAAKPRRAATSNGTPGSVRSERSSARGYPLDALGRGRSWTRCSALSACWLRGDVKQTARLEFVANQSLRHLAAGFWQCVRKKPFWHLWRREL
jgi:hypothetical protein